MASRLEVEVMDLICIMNNEKFIFVKSMIIITSQIMLSHDKGKVFEKPDH